MRQTGNGACGCLEVDAAQEGQAAQRPLQQPALGGATPAFSAAALPPVDALHLQHVSVPFCKLRHAAPPLRCTTASGVRGHGAGGRFSGQLKGVEGCQLS